MYGGIPYFRGNNLMVDSVHMEAYSVMGICFVYMSIMCSLVLRLTMQ